jgi:hypothetical protein
MTPARKPRRKRPPKPVYRVWSWEELYRHPHIRRWRFHDRDNPKRQAWERIKREARAERERRAELNQGDAPKPRRWAERIDRRRPGSSMQGS